VGARPLPGPDGQERPPRGVGDVNLETSPPATRFGHPADDFGCLWALVI
jgi:hypothetical protein